MRRAFNVLLVFAVTFNFISLGYCANNENGAMRKLGRGFANCVTFPLEIPNRIQKANTEYGSLNGTGYGICEGVAMMVMRCMVGMYEIATFPIPLPEGYAPVLNDPEFLMMEPSEKAVSGSKMPKTALAKGAFEENKPQAVNYEAKPAEKSAMPVAAETVKQ